MPLRSHSVLTSICRTNASSGSSWWHYGAVLLNWSVNSMRDKRQRLPVHCWQESLTKLCSYEHACNDLIPEVTVYSTDMWLSWASHTVGNYLNCNRLRLVVWGGFLRKLSGTYLIHAAFLEKLTGSKLVKIFPTFYGNRTFITAVTSAFHLSQSWIRSIQSMTPRLLPEDPS